MKIAYLDCLSGISGDMMLGALIDAGVDLQPIQAGIASLGLANCRLVAHEVKRKGFRATKLDVEHEPEHAHRHLHHITGMIDGSTLSDRQKDLARRIFTRLAEAEAKVHGTTVQKVHFHEVGAVDSIADIVGSAIGIDLLAVDRIVCSPIPTGHGTVQIAHGRVSVPAPATAELLQGIPLAASHVESELTTPTGAAIVSTVVDEFGTLPGMRIDRIGYGAGSRDFAEQANLVRLFVGQADSGLDTDQVWILETNLDDVSGEVVGHTTGLLLQAGALDVYATAIQMRKNRPGVMLSVICAAEHCEELEAIVFRETTALGIRRWPAARHKLPRRAAAVQTPWGNIAGKIARLGDQERFSPEYEACRQVAADHQIPLQEVYEAAHRAYAERGASTESTDA
jgi:pyridinium-3,5-bisthiocarboxylic acid mononucleotide nickel chelatase